MLHFLLFSNHFFFVILLLVRFSTLFRLPTWFTSQGDFFYTKIIVVEVLSYYAHQQSVTYCKMFCLLHEPKKYFFYFFFSKINKTSKRIAVLQPHLTNPHRVIDAPRCPCQFEKGDRKTLMESNDDGRGKPICLEQKISFPQYKYSMRNIKCF